MSMRLAHPYGAQGEVCSLAHLVGPEDHGEGRPCVGGCGHRVHPYASDQMCDACRRREERRWEETCARASEALTHINTADLAGLLGVSLRRASEYRTRDYALPDVYKLRLADWYEAREEVTCTHH